MNLCHTLDFHSLDNVDGVRLVVTINHGDILAEAILVASYEGAESYAEAIEDARGFRLRYADDGAWAIVDLRYGCGCWSVERDLASITWDGGFRAGVLQDWSDEALEDFDAGCILAEGPQFYGYGSPILRRAGQVQAELSRRFAERLASRPAPVVEPSDAPF
jgi:hypothetical protein